jgi:hypothetical protein
MLAEATSTTSGQNGYGNHNKNNHTNPNNSRNSSSKINTNNWTRGTWLLLLCSVWVVILTSKNLLVATNPSTINFFASTIDSTTTAMHIANPMSTSAKNQHHNQHIDNNKPSHQQNFSAAFNNNNNNSSKQYHLDQVEELPLPPPQQQQQQQQGPQSSTPESPVCRPHLIHYSNQSTINQTLPTATAASAAAVAVVKIRRIFLGHMRKAGGSALRAYLAQVAAHYNLTFVVAEAIKLETPGIRADTLYITHVRDPVNRTLSQFLFEGRWRCPLLIPWYVKNYKNHTNSNNNNNNSSNHTSNHTSSNHSEFHRFVPTHDNAVTLEDWIASDDQNGTCRTERQRKQIGWKCASNCYLRWLNFPRGFCAEPQDWMPSKSNISSSALFQQAWDSAHRYNLIIHMERLATDLSYVQGIEQLLGVPGLQEQRRQPKWCSNASKRANKEVPFVVEGSNNDSSIREDLYLRNKADYILYESLVTCPHGIVFPQNAVLSDLV